MPSLAGHQIRHSPARSDAIRLMANSPRSVLQVPGRVGMCLLIPGNCSQQVAFQVVWSALIRLVDSYVRRLGFSNELFFFYSIVGRVVWWHRKANVVLAGILMHFHFLPPQFRLNVASISKSDSQNVSRLSKSWFTYIWGYEYDSVEQNSCVLFATCLDACFYFAGWLVPAGKARDANHRHMQGKAGDAKV